MSRIGKQPIAIPSGVTVKAEGRSVSVKGPKGELRLEQRPEVDVAVESQRILVTRRGDERDRAINAYWGMTRSLLQNMVKGVSTGYERKLEITGVGYTAKVEGTNLVLTLGFSHPVRVAIPKEVSVTCPSQTQIVISGCDKRLVGQVAAKIRKLRPPEPYKGKGIKYDAEVVRRKAGKAFGSA
jgi:large subunit ribosomal protein L6